MTSKEIVRRVIRHQDPTRLAWEFQDPRYCDVQHVSVARLCKPEAVGYDAWGEHEALRKRTGFHGELRMDAYGNILGRLNGRTKGECVLGALQAGWEALETYAFPTLDADFIAQTRAKGFGDSDRYVLTGLPVAVFSVLRDMRRMDNALMDVAAEPERVADFLERLMPLALACVEAAADCGADGVIIADDWGMQFSPFISPVSFRTLFKPAYARIAEACHARDMDFMLHSCGFVLPLVDDMIDAGIDVFQFDQPEAAGCTLWAERYGQKAAFYSPVDIQKIMPTGDRTLIEEGARHMAECFRESGSMIAKDYPTWHDINVEAEWARWARETFVAHSQRR